MNIKTFVMKTSILTAVALGSMALFAEEIENRGDCLSFEAEHVGNFRMFSVVSDFVKYDALKNDAQAKNNLRSLERAIAPYALITQIPFHRWELLPNGKIKATEWKKSEESSSDRVADFIEYHAKLRNSIETIQRELRINPETELANELNKDLNEQASRKQAMVSTLRKIPEYRRFVCSVLAKVF